MENSLLIHPVGGAKAKVLALGDSYTYAESVDPSGRFPVQLVAELRSRGQSDLPGPDILARTGWTVEELLSAMDAEKAGFQKSYELVTVLIGVNNQYRGRSVSDFRPGLRTLLGRAKELAGGRAGRVIVVSIPDWGVMPFAEGRDRKAIGAEIDAFNAACREEAASAGMAFVDITPISREATTQPALVAPDGLHPSGDQYRHWAAEIAPVALKLLTTRP